MNTACTECGLLFGRHRLHCSHYAAQKRADETPTEKGRDKPTARFNEFSANVEMQRAVPKRLTFATRDDAKRFARANGLKLTKRRASTMLGDIDVYSDAAGKIYEVWRAHFDGRIVFEAQS